ncbi:hypothetical protein BKH46_00315 [Helicobacter sp. 12S02634-8]|uniref:DMT family transporter n=1 Tax=Helicobacter sp. 12S02634-8 TaxID=1476199 RepID=UPI000BA7CE45|nr:SMR family transporter [Helicobacter sp. 12S02634-8]PAF48392.1 hypothetical protein BKH46_00315 [Helicobacter sp. 12S02634-8]
MIPFIPLIVLSVALNAFAQLFIKKGMLTLGELHLDIAFVLKALGSAYLWAGLFCYGVSVLTWMVVLSKVNVSVAYPFLGLGFVLTLVLAYWIFGEPLDVYKIIGIVLIGAGLVFLSMARG